MAGNAHEVEDEMRVKKSKFMLTETSRCLAAQAKFYGAASLLEGMKEDEECSSIGLKLLMVECYVRLGRELKSEKAMKSIKDKFLTVPAANIDVVKTLADGYEGHESSCVREIFIRKLLSEMYLSSDMSPTEKFDGAQKCVHDIQSVAVRIYKKKPSKAHRALQDLVKKLADDSDDESEGKKQIEEETRLQVIALDYGAKYMVEIMNSLEALSEIDPKKRARDLAKCTNAIGYFYGVIKDHKRSIAMRKKGIDIMEAEFDKFAADHNMFGDLHHNIGVCLFNLDRYKEAEFHYNKAIDSYHRAVDYPTPEMRSKDLRKSESDLRQTRNRI